MMHYQANLVVKPQMYFITDQLIPWFTQLVLLFFMVSAFSMCCGYYERMKNGGITPSKFYAKRYKRVLPFFALLCMLDVAMSRTWESLAEAFMDMTLVFNLLPNPDIKVIGVGWFLGIIFVFYILFPFFVFLLDNKRRAWMVFVLSLVINLLCLTYFFTDKFIDFKAGRHNILYSSPLLIAGGLIYLYRCKLHNIAERMGNWGLLICLALTTAYFFVPQSLWTLQHVIPLIVVFGTWLIYAIGADHKWMHNKVMNFLSNISMEIYLCHMVMFRIVEKIHLENMIDNANVLYLVTCILGIGMACLFAFYVKKGLEWGMARTHIA